MINVGIIGCGFVGGALKDWLEHNTPVCNAICYDPDEKYSIVDDAIIKELK